MGRAAGNVEIHGNRAVDAVVLFGMAGERAARDRAGTDGDHDLGRWRRLVRIIRGRVIAERC